MGQTTFSGPVKIGRNDLGDVGFAPAAQSATVAFGATLSTTTIATLPAHSQILEIYVDVTTPFNAATTNYFDIGDGSTATQYADNLDVSSAARVLGTSDVSQIPNYRDIGATNLDVVVTYIQSGTAATAGAATVTVVYLPGRDLL